MKPPMQSDDEAAQIARGLTRAQRREVLSHAPWFMADLTGQRTRQVVWRGLNKKEIRPSIYAQLAIQYAGWWRLTPLGLRVRAALEAMEKNDART